MRELKRKEIIAGLIMLIILSVTAMFLIVKKEVEKKNTDSAGTVTVKSKEQEETVSVQENSTALSVTENAETNQNTQSEKNTAVKNADAGYYIQTTMKENRSDDWQMKELFGYWDDYKLEAVDDLIRLPRVRELTNALKGTGQFYYYGETNKNGQPEGNGLAIYEDNAYYCGTWKNGMRSGNGMWLKIYPDAAVTLNGIKGITAHSYNGDFLNDYPNGKGQEHFDYDIEKMSDKNCIANVIGSFSDGYYDGENIYIMTVTADNQTTDWEADAKRGSFIMVENNVNSQGKNPVWKDMNDDTGENMVWMSTKENNGYGVYGLKMK